MRVPPGRPRHFDEEAVLDELTALFWRKGYTATSVADLVETSGVHKSSLYRTFGTKEELFARILRRYFAARMDLFTTSIELAGPGIEGIHAFLDLLEREVVSGTNSDGCMLVITSTELCGTTPGFPNFGVEYRKALRQRIRVLVAKAEPDDHTSEQLTDQRTDLFTTFLLGLDVRTRGGADKNELKQVINGLHATVNTWRS